MPMSGRALVLCVAAASIAGAIAWLALRAGSDTSVVAPTESAVTAGTGSPAVAAELERPTGPPVDRAEAVESASLAAAQSEAGESVALSERVRITGRVVGPDGAPWRMAFVRADARGRPRAGTDSRGFPSLGSQESSDIEGRFAIETDAGTVRIQASAIGAAPSALIERELAPGESLEDITLVLRRGGAIEGIVLDSQDRPRKDAAVDVDFSAAGLRLGSRRTMTSVDGSFRIECVAPGPVSVSARGDRDWNSVSRVQVTVEDGQVAHVRLGGRDEGDLIVTGTVRAKSPIAGAQIVFLAQAEGAPDRDRYRTVKTDEAGRYEIRLAVPGPYFADVEAEGLARLRRTLEIPDAPGTIVDFDLPSSRVSGRVLDPDGQPLADVTVLIEPEGKWSDAVEAGSEAFTSTDADGRFGFEGIEVGEYLITTDVDGVANPAHSAFANATLHDVQISADAVREGLELRLTEGAKLLVHVLSPDGQPAKGARVTWRRSDGQGADVDADAAGVARIEGLATGSIGLFAHTASATMRQETTLDVRAGEASETTLQLVAGTVLLVRVVDSAGKRMDTRNLHVHVYDSQNRPWSHRPPGLHSWSARPFGPLPDGDYAVGVAFGSKSARLTVHVSGGKEQEVVVREPD